MLMHCTKRSNLPDKEAQLMLSQEVVEVAMYSVNLGRSSGISYMGT